MNKLANIKLIVLDVDGTMTDGKIYYDNSGNEMKAFNVKDGMAISQAIRVGVKVAIITGRTSEIVNIRGKELGVEFIIQGVNNKLRTLRGIVEELQISMDEVIYIGDDINDLDCMINVGICACPKDSAKEIIEISHIVSKFNGGDGAVREIIEEILIYKGIWENITNKFVGVSQ